MLHGSRCLSFVYNRALLNELYIEEYDRQCRI